MTFNFNGEKTAHLSKLKALSPKGQVFYAKCGICNSGWLAEIQCDYHHVKNFAAWQPKLLLFCKHLSYLETVYDSEKGLQHFFIQDERETP